MIFLGFILMILQILDIITTNIGLKNGCRERNPLMRKIYKTKVPLGMIIILQLSMSILLIWVLSLNFIIIAWIVFGLNIFLVVIVSLNLISIYIQKKYNKNEWLK